MIRKMILLILIIISIGACINKEKSKTNSIFYKDFFTNKIIEESQYKKLNDSLSMQFNLDEMIISEKSKNDSLIITYWNIRFPKEMENPLTNAKAFIGTKLLIDSLKTIDGKTVSLNSNNGRPTLVNLWFTRCPPCIEEMPELNNLKDEYNNKANFIAVTFESYAKVSKFLEKNTFNFLLTVDAKKEMDKLNNSMYPLNIFIDKKGVVRYVVGMSPKGGKLFRELLENLL
ncbi:TlpA disulfide reductase family protein [Aureibaculum sp. 2210JD6-5]|uniref:TlpA family protein disulfide reductase n=1 Tax=Aureibaculum sp. 2210JD6-5 TaxID=3103957 RepID=UPI002AACC615|nr:TlpA disulfide reductase family protein [Aureibaculum sp. 2210JD6-5]MDY7394068.1 TlpA disulfide reductase family protein [Aureibaculum sp. 2210JD6-5]